MVDDVGMHFETEKNNEMSALPPRLACKGKHFEVPKQRRLAPFPASDVVD
jgi:hypothetical protein